MDEEGPSVEDSPPSSLGHSAEDEEWRREERKTKATTVLMKLQEDKPCQPDTSRRHSNFEDCEFFKIDNGL